MVKFFPKALTLCLATLSVGAQDLPTRLWQPVQEYFTIVAPTGTGRQSREQRVNPFLSYTHLGSDFGFVGPAEARIGWEPGMVCVMLPSGAEDWAGMWHSLNRLAREPEHTLDFTRVYPALISETYQPKITGLRLELMGKGELKVEITSAQAGAAPLWSQKFTLTHESLAVLEAPLPTEQLRAAKFLNWIAEPGSDFCINSIGFTIAPPTVPFDLYVFLNCYAKAARCYSPETGLVRDRAHIEDGAFDSISATGLFHLSTVVAHKLGIVSEADARAVLKKSHQAVMALRGPYGLLPHFARRIDGVYCIHPGTEYSTVDTAIYLQASLLALRMIGEDALAEEVVQAMKSVDFTPLRDREGYVSHGVYDDRTTPIPYHWRDWGGESALVLMLQQIASDGRLSAKMSNSGRVHQGTGFIAEIASLIYPDFDEDRPDNLTKVNWRQARQTLFAEQKDYFLRHQAPEGHARHHGLFGLSAGEGAYGVGYHVGGSELPNQTIIHPHYVLMASAHIEPPQAIYDYLLRFIELDYLPPWGLSENILADGREHLPMLGALNANFECLSAYHLLARHRKIKNEVYEACRSEPLLRKAVSLFYHRGG